MQKNGFELQTTDVQFVRMTPRVERHGDEDVLAVDLDMLLKTSNDALAMLHPTLRWSLYDKPDVSNADLADKGKADEHVRLRHPSLSALKFDDELFNYVLVFHYGIDGMRDIILEDATVKKFKVICHDGGTIDLSWRVQARPSNEQLGRLAERLSMGKVSVTLEPGEPEVKQPALDNNRVPNPLDAAAEKKKRGRAMAH